MPCTRAPPDNDFPYPGHPAILHTMPDLFPSARLYDLDDGRLREDIPLYAGFARKTGGPALDLGVGAARLAIPIAREGVDVVGVDVSAPMLQGGRARIAAAGLNDRIHLVQADFRHPPLASRHFALAYCGYNAFLHLIEGQDQMRALTAWRRLLKPGGLLVIDVENPQLDGLALLMLQPGFEPEETLTDPATGEEICKSTRVQVDLSDQILHFQRLYQGGEGEGAWEVAQDLEVRILFQRELALLLDCAGYVDLRFYGDYQLNPWEPDSPRLIAVAAREPLSQTGMHA